MAEDTPPPQKRPFALMNQTRDEDEVESAEGILYDCHAHPLHRLTFAAAFDRWVRGEVCSECGEGTDIRTGTAYVCHHPDCADVLICDGPSLCLQRKGVPSKRVMGTPFNDYDLDQLFFKKGGSVDKLVYTGWAPPLEEDSDGGMAADPSDQVDCRLLQDALRLDCGPVESWTPADLFADDDVYAVVAAAAAAEVAAVPAVGRGSDAKSEQSTTRTAKKKRRVKPRSGPPPPRAPGPTAFVQAVTLHIRPRISLFPDQTILGITLRYSDGTETCQGTDHGTVPQTLTLEPNEHIVQVDECNIHDSLDYSWYYLKSLTFVKWNAITNTEVTWRSDVYTNRKDVDADQPPTHMRSTWRAPEGSVMRHIPFDSKLGQIETAIAVPLKALDITPTEPLNHRVPSLHSLARLALPAALKRLKKGRDRKVWRTFSRKLEPLEGWACKALDEINSEAIDTVRCSKEAAVVRQLQTLLKTAQGRLDRYQTSVRAVAQAKADPIRRRYDRKRAKVLTDRRVYQHSFDRKVTRAVNRGGCRGTVCTVSSCGVIFHPHDVPARLQCSVPGCQDSFQQCGCSVKPCHCGCFAPVCCDHAWAHMDHCEPLLPRRCGYTETDGQQRLSQFCCNKILAEGSAITCFGCKRSVCSNCCATCADTLDTMPSSTRGCDRKRWLRKSTLPATDPAAECTAETPCGQPGLCRGCTHESRSSGFHDASNPVAVINHIFPTQ
eukprot:m.234282 g.234282  ORF g.234282 m.234282 type:complete len:720 (+) comp26120_c0_seq2:38-2197(+)